MKVVLLDDIVNLGEAGELVDVKDGYARNFLIPQRLAEMATKDALNRVTLIRRAADAKRAKRMAEAADKFSHLAQKTLTIPMKAGTESRLFGAVTSAMIADEIRIQFGIEVDRRHVMLDEPIKHLGEFTVPLRASADVTGEVRLIVEAEVKREEIEQRLIEQARADDEAAKAEAEGAAKAPEPAEEAASAADVHEKYEAHEETTTEES